MTWQHLASVAGPTFWICLTPLALRIAQNRIRHWKGAGHD